MDGPQFDAAVKRLADGTSRRTVLGLLAGSAGGALSALLGRAHASAQPGCRREGHPCEGNQTCCEGLTCAASGPGAAMRCTAGTVPENECEGDCPPTEQVVVVVDVDIDIEADCVYSGEMRRTTCTFTAASGQGAVGSVAVPESLLCAEIVGGDYDEVDLGANARPQGKAKGFKSKQTEDGVAIVTLELAGEVTTATTATYWCETDGTMLIPVTGPGLQCEDAEATTQSDVTDSTGAVVVQIYTCDVAASADNVEWFEVCGAPTAEARFRLDRLENDDWSEVGTQGTNAEGLCSFEDLPPGTYRLEQAEGGWCHAESDSVDEQGNVIVEAGARTTVWVFHCVETK